MGRHAGWRAVVGILLIVGCVHAPPPQSTGRTYLDEDAIQALHASTAYDIVAMTHGDYLHSRGRESSDPKVPPVPADVYVDDTYYGGVDVLRAIPASEVGGIRFYQGYEAQYKFGSGHMGGVIQIFTKR